MIAIKINRMDASMILDELTKYELTLHQEYLILFRFKDTKEWEKRKRYIYVCKELNRVSTAIDSISWEYDNEWGHGGTIN